jgi:hypothetical protein
MNRLDLLSPLVAAVLLLAPAAAAEPRVAFEKGLLVGTMGPEIVSKDVATKLRSGLTTTFVVNLKGQLTPGREDVNASARVEIRYDLWDEVYVLIHQRPDGSTANDLLRSDEELAAWWTMRPVISILAPAATGFTGDLELRILPFSYREERDARGWVSRALGLQAAGPRTTSSPPEERAQSSVIDVLIATSIRAKPLAVHRWRIRTAIEGGR